MAKRKPEKPPYRAIVTAANVDPAEREIRINNALDVLIDEAMKKQSKKKRKS